MHAIEFAKEANVASPYNAWTSRPPIAEPRITLRDDRFCTLLGEAAWQRLPAPVRERFGKRVRGGSSVTFQGIVTQMFMSRAGWALAQLCRVVGAPLPYERDAVGMPAIVVVTEDPANDGQFWIRQYGRRCGFPQTVHSSKRFSGPTGLEEIVGYGIGMALRVEATNTALLFKSERYFITVFGYRLPIPRWLCPGALTIGHHERGNGTFAYTLSLMHPLLGVMIHQKVVFARAGQIQENCDG